jgi:hypothetical protein
MLGEVHITGKITAVVVVAVRSVTMLLLQHMVLSM